MAKNLRKHGAASCVYGHAGSIPRLNSSPTSGLRLNRRDVCAGMAMGLRCRGVMGRNNEAVGEGQGGGRERSTWKGTPPGIHLQSNTKSRRAQRSSATWSRPCASHTNARQHSHSNTPRTYRDDTYMPDVRHAQTIDEHASTPISDDRTPPNFRAHCACLHRAHGRTTITTFASWSLAKVAPPS